MGIPVAPKKKFPYGLVAAGIMLAGLGFAVVKVIVEPMGDSSKWIPVKAGQGKSLLHKLSDLTSSETMSRRLGMVVLGGVAVAVGFTVLTSYVIDPLKEIDNDKWKNIQKETRAGVNQEQVQPGGMRVWSNPFEEKKGK